MNWWKDSCRSGKHNDEVWLGAIHFPPIFKISYWLFLWVLALKYLPPMSNDWWQTILKLTIGHWPEFDKLRRIKWKLKRLIKSNWIVPLLFTRRLKTINWKKMLKVTTQLFKSVCHYDVAFCVCISLLKQTEPLLAPLDSQW